MPLRTSPWTARPAGEAEVHDEDLSAAVDHDVGGLQVAMQDAFVVRRSDKPGLSVH